MNIFTQLKDQSQSKRSSAFAKVSDIPFCCEPEQGNHCPAMRFSFFACGTPSASRLDTCLFDHGGRYGMLFIYIWIGILYVRSM